MFCILKKWKYVQLLFQKLTQIVEEITLLMIPDEKDWYYLAAKKETALVKEVTSKNNIDFYCLNCLHSFRTENKPKCYEKACKSKKKIEELLCQLKKIMY